jgi:hypothetical protein
VIIYHLNIKYKIIEEISMKKFYLVLAVICFTALIACGGGQTPTDPHGAWVRAANSELAQHSVGGFAYKRSDLSAAAWNSWFNANGSVIQRILAETPDGYVLQITGHTCSRGPELAEGRKPGNIKLSSDRARTVYNSLVRAGIDSSKLVHRGVGSSQPIDGIDPSDARQRRVSFRVVQQ